VIYAPHGFYFTYHPEGSRSYRRYLALERALASRTAALHCVSHAELRVATEHGLLGRSPAHVLPNPVTSVARDAERCELRRSLGVADGERLVVMVARLVAPKDPETFARAAVMLPADTRCVLVGDGPLAGVARQIGGARLHRAGARDDARRVAAAADVVVLASHSEALPMTLCEAVTDGVPVVATDLPGCREAAGDGGLFVPPRDEAALAAAVATLLRDDDLHARLSASGRAHAARFDEERWLDGVVATYRSVISRAGDATHRASPTR
jgi:glycosyltransferase involved in cell wall biosynthesis